MENVAKALNKNKKKEQTSIKWSKSCAALYSIGLVPLLIVYIVEWAVQVAARLYSDYDDIEGNLNQ